MSPQEIILKVYTDFGPDFVLKVTYDLISFDVTKVGSICTDRPTARRWILNILWSFMSVSDLR